MVRARAIAEGDEAASQPSGVETAVTGGRILFEKNFSARITVPRDRAVVDKRAARRGRVSVEFRSAAPSGSGLVQEHPGPRGRGFKKLGGPAAGIGTASSALVDKGAIRRARTASKLRGGSGFEKTAVATDVDEHAL